MYDRDTAMPPLPDVQLVRKGAIWRVDQKYVPDLMALEPMVRHAVHHRICQNVYKQTKGEPPAPKDRSLNERGVALLPKRIPAALAGRLSEFTTELLRSNEGKPKVDYGGFDEFKIDDANVTVSVPKQMQSVFLDLLPAIIDAEAEAMVEAYLGSFFRIDHCALYRTRRTNEPLVSFRWHRDVASMGQVHIMLYLTPSGDGRGATEFIPLADTRRMAEIGYSFVNPDQREAELDDVRGLAGPRPEVFRPSLDPGDAVVFGAPRILHRGVQPAEGFRDVLLLVLLPSTVPWRVEIEELGRDHLLVGADRDAYMSNPFVPFNPAKPERRDGLATGTTPPPGWSQLSYFWPP